MSAMVDFCHTTLDIKNVDRFIQVRLVKLFLGRQVGNESFDELYQVGHGKSFGS